MAQAGAGLEESELETTLREGTFSRLHCSQSESHGFRAKRKHGTRNPVGRGSSQHPSRLPGLQGHKPVEVACGQEPRKLPLGADHVPCDLLISHMAVLPRGPPKANFFPEKLEKRKNKKIGTSQYSNSTVCRFLLPLLSLLIDTLTTVHVKITMICIITARYRVYKVTFYTHVHLANTCS